MKLLKLAKSILYPPTIHKFADLRDDLSSKFPEYEDNIFELAAHDPSGNYQYLSWQVEQMIKGFLPVNDLIRIVDLFHKYKKYIFSDNINDYNDYDALKREIDMAILEEPVEDVDEFANNFHLKKDFYKKIIRNPSASYDQLMLAMDFLSTAGDNEDAAAMLTNPQIKQKHIKNILELLEKNNFTISTNTLAGGLRDYALFLLEKNSKEKIDEKYTGEKQNLALKDLDKFLDGRLNRILPSAIVHLKHVKMYDRTVNQFIDKLMTIPNWVDLLSYFLVTEEKIKSVSPKIINKLYEKLISDSLDKGDKSLLSGLMLKFPQLPKDMRAEIYKIEDDLFYNR